MPGKIQGNINTALKTGKNILSIAFYYFSTFYKKVLKTYVCVEEGTTGGSKTRFKLRRYFTISFQCFLDDFRRYWMIAQRRNWLSSNNKWAKAKNVQNWYNYSGLLHFHNLVCYSFYNNLIKFIFVNRYHKEVI